MQKVNFKKYIYKPAGKAICEFNMIDDGDVILLGLSGGKDSWVLLDTLYHFKKKAPINFDIVAAKLNYDDVEDNTKIKQFIEKNYPLAKFNTISSDIKNIIKTVKIKGNSMCSVCSRLRRGFLYSFANKINATKIALGHHREDFNETLLMSMFFNSCIKSMAAKLITDDKKNTVIRPLVYVAEDDILKYSIQKKFPIYTCLCPKKTNTNRDYIKNLLNQLQKDIPQIKNSMIYSQKRIIKSHLLNK